MSSKDGRQPLNGYLLKQLRKQKGLSQEKLAEQCAEKCLYVSLSSIKRAESGNSILYRTAKELAKFYDVSVESLIQNSASDLQNELATVSECKRQVFRFAIEISDENISECAGELKDGSYSNYYKDDNFLEFNLLSDSKDEFVFERMRRLCAMLQSTLKSQI
jgi:transcriptional regulator with XRE-family HTH domain